MNGIAVDRTAACFDRKNAGVALLLAISLLAIFVILGTAYVRFMSLEVDESAFELRRERAEVYAVAGVYAALADLERAVSRGRAKEMLAVDHAYSFGAYDDAVPEGDRFQLSMIEDRNASAIVTITPESGKVNLNHAPASVLQLMLGVDGATARRITSSLPGPIGGGQTGAWLLSPSDLVARGLLTPEQFARVNLDNITTYTVLDHANPARFLDINAASVEVLMAVLDVPRDTATKISLRLQESPIADLSVLSAAAGKDPATFNMKPDPGNPTALPREFALESRVFRIQSTGIYADVGRQDTELRPTRGYVEAIVMLDDAGSYRFVRWTTSEGIEEVKEAPAEVPAEAVAEVDT